VQNSWLMQVTEFIGIHRYVDNYERLGVLRGDDLIFNQSFKNL
jgi:hypothetical protein